MMDATEWKAEFRKWLVDPDGGNKETTTRNTYISAIEKFQEELLGGKNFYACDIAHIDTIKNENELTFDALNRKRGGAINAAIKAYRAFLHYAPIAPQHILHKAPQNIDITQDVTEALLVHLFIKTYQTNFPGYELYRDAQGRNCKDFSVLLEHPAEKKALFVVLVPHSTDSRQDLLEHVSADFHMLRELFHKAGETLSMLVVAGQFGVSFKAGCSFLPDTRLARYSLGALELQDA
ncbi:MAG: hypothetical protein HDR32_12465 [Treponema sp.]|nr:hypothetical protein [Treponema sp.]MBD5448512.1 hypothetical protein [Treponema sp.]